MNCRELNIFKSVLGRMQMSPKQALKSIKGLETKKYKPRQYEELFENCVLNDRRLQRDDLHRTAHVSSDVKRRYSVEATFDEKDGEETMAEERSFTPNEI